MKTLLITLFFSLQISANNCEHLTKIRSLFQTVVNKKQLENVLLFCEKSTCDNIIPYHAAATMKRAEFVWSPIRKLSNFNKGKKMLEVFIANNPKNIEARYLRWLTQKEAPKFLGYHYNVDEDYKFIQENIHKSDLEKSYQKIILNHLKKIENE